MVQQRVLAGGTVEEIIRQDDRQLIFGDRDDPVALAVDDGYGCAPRPLAAGNPVADAITHGEAGLALFGEPFNDCLAPIVGVLA